MHNIIVFYIKYIYLNDIFIRVDIFKFVMQFREFISEGYIE